MHCRRHLPSPHQKRVVFCCCKITFFFFVIVWMYVNFFIAFFWVQRVYWCADCVCYFIAFAITPCYFVVAVVVFTLCVFCVSNASSRLDEKICQKTAQNMRSFCSFFCRSEWLFVCACVYGWVCKLILVILIDLLQAGFCFLAITKSHINKIIKAAKRRTISVGSGSAVGVEESAARRLCSFLCVCVWVCKAKGKTEKTKPNMWLCVCVCIYLLLLLRRMAHSKSEISTRISL